MLTIRNIKQIELTFCHSRGLREVTETENKMGDKFYSFHFGPISDGNRWNKETEVRLSRDMQTPGGGYYQIFVMGLQMSTRYFVTIDDIKSKDGLVLAISKVLAQAKWWWENEATK